MEVSVILINYLADYGKAIKYHEKRLKIAIEIGDREAQKEEAMEVSVMLTNHWVTMEKPLRTHEKRLQIAVGHW